jgi:hypothetical protein
LEFLKGKKGNKGVIGAFQIKEMRERHHWSFSKGKNERRCMLK